MSASLNVLQIQHSIILLINMYFCIMETLIVQPKTKEQLTALKAFIKAMKIDFKSEKSLYDPAFVEKINQGREDIKNGKGVKIDTRDLWK
jgi:hypothetical protein